MLYRSDWKYVEDLKRGIEDLEKEIKSREGSDDPLKPWMDKEARRMITDCNNKIDDKMHYSL